MSRGDYMSLSEVSGGAGAEEAAREKLGLKRITLFGSIVILTNTICGPGMVVLPRVYQEAGYVIPTLVFMLICISSSLASTFLCDCMARIPGNSRFERRIEFVNIFDNMWGKWGLRVAQAMFMVNMMAQTVSSIIANAQVMDSLVVFLNPSSTTYALEVYPNVGIVAWSPPMNKSVLHGGAQACHAHTPEPFHSASPRLIVTLGYALLGVILIPFSTMTLEENVMIQKISFFTMVIGTLEFLWQFTEQGLDNHPLPAFAGNYTHVVGSIIFNYAFACFIPSWVNEKKPDVSINISVWVSTISSTIMYILIGIMGATAYNRAPGNFLSAASNHCSPNITRISAFVFAFGMIGLGIPFNSIVTRYSLQVGKACGPRWAIFWSVAFPWGVSWLFYGDGMLGELVSWMGDLDIGPLNFLLPILAALTSLGVVGFSINWLNPSVTTLRDDSVFSVGDAAPKHHKHLRHSMSIASEADCDDLANGRTVVDPLPGGLNGFYRPIATMTVVVLVSLMLLSIASHSRKLLFSLFDNHPWY